MTPATILEAPGPAELLDVLALCKAHPDYALFVRAMLSAPEDETLRLVFADWLQEQGCEWHAEQLRKFRFLNWNRVASEMGAALAPVFAAVLNATSQLAAALAPAMANLTHAFAALAKALPSPPSEEASQG